VVIVVWRASARNAYALLAVLLREERGILSLPDIARRTGGKPFFPKIPSLFFNVSHSGTLALCVLSEREVGADIETVRPRRAGLPRYALSEEEFAWYQHRGSHWEDFFTLWTLKEARVKCTGEGLTRPPRTISVPLLPPGEEAEWQGFQFHSFAGDGWRGAVCEMRPETWEKSEESS